METCFWNPFSPKKLSVLISVASVGIFGSHGWIIPLSVFPILKAIRSNENKPGIVNNLIIIRKYLAFIAQFNHNIVDRAHQHELAVIWRINLK